MTWEDALNRSTTDARYRYGSAHFLYLEWVIIGRLILFVSGGEKVCARFGAFQVEVRRNRSEFVSS